MRARLVVFPVKGRNWCFSRSIDPSLEEAASSLTPSTLRHLWKKISSSSNSSAKNVELVLDFASNKMNKAWMGLEKAPEGTIKNKLHGLGLKLLSRVKPSEIFLKSISKEVSSVEITYPSSLNARLVRRRLRHIAMRGAAIHKKYFYGSVMLLPLSSALAVLPLPNIPFFWFLFRSYSNWRALQGSEKLLQLVSDCSYAENPAAPKGSEPESEESKHKFHSSQDSLWVLQPSKDLQELLDKHAEENGLNDTAISDICKTFSLNATDVSKFRHSM
ncbi:K+-H+ EXCHANGE-LIKE PROTEIN [Salix koriyanagi]|uniref:K+-H+ EXCHANGE-LIKE PROTEIN n=1 Tax=Salix koriyanagi TaxID=2511006 RepID=A0A9Q0T5A9_9ROSI|nr:K+-H+ EXCHANGE-LIKE PROTEIN [Salix koriyanagi]